MGEGGNQPYIKMTRTSGSSGSTNYNDLLKKTEHYDKDERYMAISDLCEALKRSIATQAHPPASATTTITEGVTAPAAAAAAATPPIDPQTERRICSAVLSLLDDSSNDVQTVAVKTLSVLLTTVQEQQVIEIADRLCTLVLDLTKSDLRDVYAIGLKTLVETIPTSMGNVVCHRLINRLIDGIHANSSNNTNSKLSTSTSSSSSDDKSSEEIVLACLNVLTDLLTRFGSSSTSIGMQHESLLTVALNCSIHSNSSPRLRKRAGVTIGVLATVIADTLLHRLVERILDQIDQADGITGKNSKSLSSSSGSSSSKKRARNAPNKTEAAAAEVSSTSSSISSSSADIQSLIRTMCTVSGAVGHRLNQGHIDRIVPIFLRFVDPADAVTGDDDDIDEEDDDGNMNDDENYDSDEVMADANTTAMVLGVGAGGGGISEGAAAAAQIELRESCFAGFESFVLRCPSLIQPHLDKIVLSSLAYMRFDPNYSYGDENNDEDGEEFEGEDEEEEEEEYSDEDDMSDEEDDENVSWKALTPYCYYLSSLVI